MLTGDLKSKIDQIWNAFWSGGIANPIEVIEQITYLLFLRRLDDLHTLEENKATRLKRPIERRIFPEGTDPRGRAYDSLRWSRFKNEAPSEMFTIVGEHVFPFLRTLGSDDSTYAHHMKDARFTIPTPALLAKVVDLLDAVPMDNRDTKGDYDVNRLLDGIPQKPHVLLLEFLLAHIHPFSSAVRTASPCHTSFVPRSRVRTRNGR